MQEITTFQFKDSQYDFDETLIGAGYKIINDYENQVIFEKNIMPTKPFDPNTIRPNGLSFKINVIRPKILNKNGRYDMISPYSIIFIYQTLPMLLLRRVQWDTFPGESSDTLADVLTQCEAEAEAILTMFLDVDIKNIEWHKQNPPVSEPIENKEN